jgi:hypothetical protein
MVKMMTKHYLTSQGNLWHVLAVTALTPSFVTTITTMSTSHDTSAKTVSGIGLLVGV